MRRIKHLPSGRTSLKRMFRNKFVYLFLDYDGTLSPIAKAPENATMPHGIKEVISRLSRMPDLKLAIVSGRALNDIKNRIGLKEIVYVGNHGFEIRGPKIQFQPPVPSDYEKTLDEIKNKLKKRLSSIKGVLFEDKGFCLSVHYRSVTREDIPFVETAFHATVLLYEIRSKIEVRHGKMELEIRPAISWDKGKAVSWLLARQESVLRRTRRKILPIYIGDDVTDEDAFRILRNRGVTISVGKSERSEAEYYLKNTKEVGRFLKQILELQEP